MKRDSWPVLESEVSDRLFPGRCIWCQTPVGEEHRSDCACRTRTVVIRATFEIVRRVPEDWHDEAVNFHLNDSSWCASNLIHEIEILESHLNCLCPKFKGEYVREATEEDEEFYRNRIAEPAPELVEDDEQTS